MGNRGKALKRTSVVLAGLLSLAACTSDAEDTREGREGDGERPGVVSESAPAAEHADRLTNRLVGLTDLQGRALYVLPEAQTRTHLEALAIPPVLDRVYTPAGCAPVTAFTPPPTGLEGVLGRSNLSEDQSTLRVEIYTAPDGEELVDYFVGDDPAPSVGCEEFSVSAGEVTRTFSYTRLDRPLIAPHAGLAQYSLTQDGSTTHHLRVTAVNGSLAASMILSTTEPANQAMTDQVLDLTQQAIS